jgi:tetratricopeptide (TPR) repeat protein
MEFKIFLIMISMTCVIFTVAIHVTAVYAGTSKMFTYNDPNYGTKIQYPSNWKFIIDEGEPTFFPPETDPSEEYIASVWISKRNLNQSTGIGYYLDYSRQYYDNFPDIEVIKAVSNSTLGGYPAYVLEWNETDENGNQFNTMKVGTLIGIEEYYVTYEATAEKYQEYLPIVHQMLSSFKIQLAEKNIPYVTISPTIWSDDGLDVYVVVDPESKVESSKYVQDATSAINKWSELLKKYSNNTNAWNFDIHLKTESLSENERYQSEDRFNPPANIIVELKANSENDNCGMLGESISPTDVSRYSVYSYIYTSCLGVEYTHDVVYSTVLHEFAHDLGLGHTYYKHGDLMCSREEDKHKRQFTTCTPALELKEVPSDLNIEGLIYRYGSDGLDTPNKKLKGEEPRYYQELALGTTIDNKTKIDRLLTQGWTAIDFGKTDEANRLYDSALLIDPKDTDALYAKGWVVDSLGKYEEAISYYDKILTVNPEDTFTLYAKGYALDSLGKYDEAISTYDKVLAIDPNTTDAIHEKGYSLDRSGRHDEAISYFDSLLYSNPADTEALYGKGDALDSLGRHDEAITYYDKVLAINPNDSDALHNKGYALYSLGKYEDAISNYDKTLLLEPDASQTLYRKGNALFSLGHYQDAITYYDKALVLDPTHIDALYDKANALETLGNYKEAISFYDKVLSINSSNADALNKRNDILKKIGIS